MSRRSLPRDCVLARTPEGNRRMRERSAGLPARLRSVLFLVDGSQPLSRILGKAGQLGPILEEQLGELLDMGLLEGVGGAAPRAAPAAASVPARAPAPVPARIAQGPAMPIVGAKVQLLDALERLAGGRLKQHGSTLVEARTWSDLASRARLLAQLIQEVAGPEASTRFWAEAKEILVTCRGQEAETARP